VSFYVASYGVLAVFLALLIGASFVPAFQVWNLAKIGHRINLGLPADLDPSFRRRMGGRIRASAIGGLVGTAIMSVLVWCVPALLRGDDRTTTAVFYGALLVTITGMSIGVATAACGGVDRSADGRARIARLRVTTVADYVPAIVRRLACLVVVVQMATVVVLLAGGLSSRNSRVVGATVVVASLVAVNAGAVAVFAAASRRIVARGRQTIDTDELVWDDALRSEDIRTLLDAPLRVLSIGCVYGVLAASSPAADWALIPACAGLLAFVVFAIALRNNRDWFLRRLWPDARRRSDDEEAERLAARATAP
jgi:hypothetical protein